MSQMSSLLDSKLQPIVNKLDRLEAQVSKIEDVLMGKKNEGRDMRHDGFEDPEILDSAHAPPAINPALAADMRSLLTALKVKGMPEAQYSP